MKRFRNVPWKYRALYLMMVPALLYYFIYRILPMYGLIIAFKDYNIMLGIIKSPWAEPLHKHFLTFIRSPYFVQLLTNTFLISLYKLLFGMLPPIIFALMLNECNVARLKKTVQTLSYASLSIMDYYLWHRDDIFIRILGLVNQLIKQSGGKPLAVLTSTEYFRALLVVTEIWKELGWGAIIYLAAITSINTNLFEAAHIDGAGRLRCIWNITIPSIKQTIVLLLVLRLGTILDAGFTQIFVMYNIQVYSVADILDTWVYRTGLQQLNFSLSSAVGLFKSLVGIFLIGISSFIAGKMGEKIW